MLANDLDLNLLRLIPVLQETGSVSRAAEKMGMSQPGFSSALARLRQQLDDPLFIRTGTGMQPTPLAQRLAEMVGDLLGQFDEELAREAELHPAMLRPRFRIALTDAGEPSFLPALIDRIQRAAPDSGLDVETAEPSNLANALETGEIELTIGYYPELTKSTFKRQKLFEQRLVCVAATGHRAIVDGAISSEAYFTYGHFIVNRASRSEAMLERFLKDHGQKRRIVLSSPHLLGMPFVIGASDLLATLPDLLARTLARHHAIQVVELPFAAPAFLVSQYWHSRFDRQPRSRWLRSQLADIFLSR